MCFLTIFYQLFSQSQISQINFFLQSRESDDPRIRSARLAKDALHHAQVIHTCMSLQFIQMAVSCIYMSIISLLLCMSNFYDIYYACTVSVFCKAPSYIYSLFAVHYKQTHW